jgi:hypothetical protein
MHVTDWGADDSGVAGECRSLVGETRTPTRWKHLRDKLSGFAIVPNFVIQFSVAASYKIKYLSKLTICDYNVQSIFHQVLLVYNVTEWV